MALSENVLNELKAGVRGALIGPSDEGYDGARHVWNGNIDRRPALIVRCAGAADVIAAVGFARANDLAIAVRGGGHSAAGYGTCDDGVVIDLSGMKGIRVDPARQTAQAQPGLTWMDFDRETQAFGLATTGGTVSNTGIAGLTLGGGEGWLQGLHGLTCDNLLAADVVTADGQLIHATPDEHADLFWGLRGGGGNFGIVTSFEYQLHPVGPLVMGGMVLYPLAAARDVLRFYRDFCGTLPDAAAAFAALLNTPDGMPVVALILGHNGPLEEGERALAPARQFGSPIADLISPMPYTVRQTLLDEGFGTFGLQRYWKSGLATELSDDLIDTAVEAAGHFSSPMSSIALIYINGAATRVPSDATAYAPRRPQWDINAVGQWVDPSESAQHTAATRELWTRVEPLTGGSAYINHIAADDSAEKIRASFGSNYARLAALKQAYDPANVFRLNPNVRPA